MKQNQPELHVHGVCHECASKTKVKKVKYQTMPQKSFSQSVYLLLQFNKTATAFIHDLQLS